MRKAALLSFFTNMTIRSKLMLLSGILLAALLGISFLGGETITGLQGDIKTVESNIPNINSDANSVKSILDKQQESLNRLATANAALREFGELKYWMTDLSASWLNQSETNADKAKTALLGHLKDMQAFAPEDAKIVGDHVKSIYDLGLQAVDAYADNNRVLGNSLLANARDGILKADAVLLKVSEDQKMKVETHKREAGESFDIAAKQVDTAQQHAKEAIVRADASLKQASAVLVLVLLIAVSFTFVTMRSLINPIRKLVHSMGELANGNLRAELPSVTANEIGDMIKAVEVFKNNSIMAEKLKADQAAEQSKKEERQRRIEGLIKGFETKATGAVSTVASAAEELNQTAKFMGQTISSTNQKSSEASASSEKASSNVQTVASAAEEMNSSIQEISEQTSKTTAAAREAVNKAQNADKSAASLENAANKIGEVLQLIQDITEQINLLALNATIEAARAGEAGKGFAVVASEVKNLASQTAHATEEIESHINGIQGVSKEVIGVLNTIKASISSVGEYANGIATAVEEQTAVTREIAANMNQASSGVMEITSNLSEVAKMSQEADNSANEVLGAAQTLAKQADMLRNEINGFLKDIQAA
ncbi:MAG: methyl-accepting chemotaxis protein [Proteobacteria bacterium]|nr:methyl-accepting chemotaxis protein [Pseudomonadota bacterium]